MRMNELKMKTNKVTILIVTFALVANQIAASEVFQDNFFNNYFVFAQQNRAYLLGSSQTFVNISQFVLGILH